MRLSTTISVVVFAMLLFVKSGSALSPEEVAVVVNKNAWHSIDLGKYYQQKRSIPEDNILRLWTTDNETISRENYEKQIAEPVAKFLEERKKQGREIHCLVLMFGMPLKITPPEFSREEQRELADLQKRQGNIQESLAKLEKEDAEYKSQTNELQKITATIKKLNNSRNRKGASVESELSLIQTLEYSLENWIGNPLFLPLQKKLLAMKPESIILVSRLDGPDEKTVKRIIDDSIEAERNGLKGIAYFDARYKAPAEDKVKKLQGYGYYDWSIHQAAAFFKQQNILPVVLDDNKKLFQKGEAPEAAIYCGWYSLSNYVDAFEWQPGAVGFHIASGECVSLKTKNNQWCRNILEKGAAVTIGPVGEPYLQAFPIPELFFKLLTDGRFSLVESYYLSLPSLSWKMILIGDPLYKPFKNWSQVVN